MPPLVDPITNHRAKITEASMPVHFSMRDGAAAGQSNEFSVALIGEL